MRLIDRYILTEFLGPFLFGIGTFMVILVGVQLSPEMLKLMVREHYPANVVLLIFLYRLPQVLALTFPMATVFGSLMALASLSGHGEVTAMRAGSVSLQRLATPILCTGLLVSLMNFGFNELLVPAGNDAAHRLTVDYSQKARPLEHLKFWIPSEGEPERAVYARSFDPGQKVLQGLSITEFRNGKVWETFRAGLARWQGDKWVLEDVEHKVTTGQGTMTFRLAKVEHDIGKDPTDLARLDKKIGDMSLSELYRELRQRRWANRPLRTEQLEVMQSIQMHWSLPWASLGLALIGIPLGLRPARATTGIGLGLSLVIVFAYYIIFHTMQLIGEQGALSPVVAAWTPNAILLVCGLSLFFSARR